MYAIIKEDGKQIKVEEGQEVRMDYRENASAGDELNFTQILAVSGDDGITLGKPIVEGASVTAEVIGVERGDKLVVQKFRRRKNSKRRNGHRQFYTRVRIGKIAV